METFLQKLSALPALIKTCRITSITIKKKREYVSRIFIQILILEFFLF